MHVIKKEALWKIFNLQKLYCATVESEPKTGTYKPDFIISQVARLDGFSPAYNRIFFENLRNIKADYTNKSRLTYVNYVPLSIH